MADNNTIQSILNKASKDKFTMVLSLPPLLQRINTSNQKDRTGNTVNLNSLQFSVWGTVIPASYVPHVEARYGGQTMKVTSYSRPSYPNINVNFVVDNGFRNYYLLWKWLDLLNSTKKSTFNNDQYLSLVPQLSSYHEYMTDLTIFAKDEYENNIAQFTYSHAFITRLEGITYNHQDPEQIESTFEFAFGQLDIQLL